MGDSILKLLFKVSKTKENSSNVHNKNGGGGGVRFVMLIKEVSWFKNTVKAVIL